MKAEKRVLLIYVIVFVLLLVLPILTINRVEGKLSTAENRYLGVFPTFFDDEGHLSPAAKSGFETWLGDNIGFRSEFVHLAADIKVLAFHQSPNDRVEFGHDGWLFYTPEHNVELGAGEYVLTPGDLEVIANNQQRISNWYRAQGIDYLLVLMPAKTSIYPEYIASRDAQPMETICDQVEEYLRQNTTVNVLNVKPYLLDRKKDGQLYLKTDTHMTQFGYYIAYQAMRDKLAELGYDFSEFDISFSEENVNWQTDLPRIMGISNNYGEDTTSSAHWEISSTPQKNAVGFEDYYTSEGINTSGDITSFLKNNSAENGTILVYGDSHWFLNRCVPYYFGESFKTVITTLIRSIDRDLDSIADPEVVIFSCGERVINTTLTAVPSLSGPVDGLPDLPMKQAIDAEIYGKWIWNHGTRLDTCNGVWLDDSRVVSVPSTAETVDLKGWTADFFSGMPLSALYLKVGDTVFQCDYGSARADVATNFSNGSLKYTGFSVSVLMEYFKGGHVEKIEFYGVSSDGKYLFTPAEYQIIIS